MRRGGVVGVQVGIFCCWLDSTTDGGRGLSQLPSSPTFVLLVVGLIWPATLKIPNNFPSANETISTFRVRILEFCWICPRILGFSGKNYLSYIISDISRHQMPSTVSFIPFSLFSVLDGICKITNPFTMMAPLCLCASFGVYFFLRTLTISLWLVWYDCYPLITWNS